MIIYFINWFQIFFSPYRALGPKTELPIIPSPHQDDEDDTAEEDAGGDVKGQDGKVATEDGNAGDDDDACGNVQKMELETRRRDEEECVEESSGDGEMMDREGEWVENVFQCNGTVCTKYLFQMFNYYKRSWSPQYYSLLNLDSNGWTHAPVLPLCPEEGRQTSRAAHHDERLLQELHDRLLVRRNLFPIFQWFKCILMLIIN